MGGVICLNLVLGIIKKRRRGGKGEGGGGGGGGGKERERVVGEGRRCEGNGGRN